MGNNVDVEELQVVVFDKEDVFLVLFFDNFVSLSGFLLKVMCEVVSKYIV